LKQTSDRQNAEPEELVCYCLGDTSELNVAFQLAFFLQIAHHFGIPPKRRFVFDPIHTEKDRQVLKLCGCTPLSYNEHAMRRVNRRTLFYMPFAPYDLTDNLLRANWDVLDRVIVIGNPLNWVVDHKWKDTDGTDGNEGHTGPNIEFGTSAEGVEVKQHRNRQQQLQARRESYTSRAPCVEAALELATEATLWQGNLMTWSLTQAEAEMEKENAQIEALKDEEKDRFLSEYTSPTAAAQRAMARYSLNASLAIFDAPPPDWPKQPPSQQALEAANRFLSVGLCFALPHAVLLKIYLWGVKYLICEN
jgi:hypothetical protein